jgi:hypothetical protein
MKISDGPVAQGWSDLGEPKRVFSMLRLKGEAAKEKIAGTAQS